jgi:hypothetical protein
VFFDLGVAESADCLETPVQLEGTSGASGGTVTLSPGGVVESTPPFNTAAHPSYLQAQWSYGGITGSFDGPLFCGAGAFSPFCTGFGNAPYVVAQAQSYGNDANGYQFSTDIGFFYTCPFSWSVSTIFYYETIKVGPNHVWQRAVGFGGHYRGPGIPTPNDFGQLSVTTLSGGGLGLFAGAPQTGRYNFLTVNQWPPALLAQFQADMAANQGPSLAEWTTVGQPVLQWNIEF